MGTYNVVIVDDHTMFREGVRKIIEEIEDVKISGEAGDGLELLKLLKNSSPDLVILDLSMPNIPPLKISLFASSACRKRIDLIASSAREQ